jgi:spore germination protein YaaH
MREKIVQRFPYSRLIALLLSLVLILSAVRGQMTRPPEPPPRPRFQVSAWVPYWDRARVKAALTAHAAELDEVNFFWYEARPGGGLRAFPGAEDAALLGLARAHGARVLPTVTNDFDGGRIAALLADPAARDAHVQALAALVEKMDYDGIEIDYEALPAEARDDFSAFVEALAAALHGSGGRLSVAVHSKTDERGAWHGPQAQDWPRLGAAADALKVMAYDYHWHSGPPGPIAPLDWIDAVLTYAKTAAPPDKIWLAIPFYGRDWDAEEGRGLVWAGVEELIRQHRPFTHRDASSGEIYFTYAHDGVRHAVYASDAQAVAVKVRAARKVHPDIAGIAIWRLGGESPFHWAAIAQER